MSARIVYDRTKLGYLVGRVGERDDPFDDPAAILVQTDYDYPGLASSFGWNICDVQPDAAECPPDRACSWPCDHSATDGTIACGNCGTPALTFIESAAAWLDDNAGITADDPGYFDEVTARS